MRKSLLSAVIAATAVFTSCSPEVHIRRSIQAHARQFHYHAGFVLADPLNQKTLVHVHGDRYFTPASNTKVLTLLAAATFLRDTLPALQYSIQGDSLIFRGTGDPSFLNPFARAASPTLELLENFKGALFLNPGKHQPDPYGTGWSWDDFDAYYQAERSELPMYGQVVHLKHHKQRTFVVPEILSDSVILRPRSSTGFRRHRHANRFYLTPNDSSVGYVPFITSSSLTRQLLEDTLKRPVFIYAGTNNLKFSELKGVPADSLIKTMMQSSDNFIADQLLLMCGRAIADSLHDVPAIVKMKSTYFSDLPAPPVWVDGSGLSRYNQMSPETFIRAWTEILKRIPEERLRKLINSYPAGSKAPYILAKTGSLSNNWSLSGLIRTRSGRLLLFSSMNANFTVPARVIRTEIEKNLKYIHDRF